MKKKMMMTLMEMMIIFFEEFGEFACEVMASSSSPNVARDHAFCTILCRRCTNTT